MSRTHHRTNPNVARRRKALRTATTQIEEAWTFTGWGGRSCRRRGTEMVLAFRAYMRELDGAEWWKAVANVRQWLPRRWRRTGWAS